jgi:hypothetical protein
MSAIRRQDYYDTSGNPVARVDSPGPDDSLVIVLPIKVVHPRDVEAVTDALRDDPTCTPSFQPAKLKKGVPPKWISLPGDENRTYNINPMAGTAQPKPPRSDEVAYGYKTADQLLAEQEGERPEGN